MPSETVLDDPQTPIESTIDHSFTRTQLRRGGIILLAFVVFFPVVLGAHRLASLRR